MDHDFIDTIKVSDGYCKIMEAHFKEYMEYISIVGGINTELLGEVTMRDQCKDCGEHVVYCTCGQRDDLYDNINKLIQSKASTDGSLNIKSKDIDKFINAITDIVYSNDYR